MQILICLPLGFTSDIFWSTKNMKTGKYLDNPKELKKKIKENKVDCAHRCWGTWDGQKEPS